MAFPVSATAPSYSRLAAAAFSARTSIFFIFIIALITRSAFLGSPANKSGSPA
jgi:hypothetical protein